MHAIDNERVMMGTATRALLLIVLSFGAACASSGTEPAASNASTEAIDVHVHAAIDAADASLATLSALLTENDVSGNVLMSTPLPLTSSDPEVDDSAMLIAFVSSQSGVYRVLYGGAELEPLLHAVGSPQALTAQIVYPNGGAPSNIADALAGMAAIRADAVTGEATFRARAEAAATSGLYAGFGEIAALHYSLGQGHPFIAFPADHAWMLILSDIAAAHALPIDLHMEATEETIAEIENLLAHNRATKIIWSHAGWTNTGLATAERLSALLTANSNLYVSIKIREADSDELQAGSPLDATLTLKSEWMSLLTNFSDRIMIGTDAKYWQQQGGEIPALSTTFSSAWEPISILLGQISGDTLQNVRHDTAAALFGY